MLPSSRLPRDREHNANLKQSSSHMCWVNYEPEVTGSFNSIAPTDSKSETNNERQKFEQSVPSNFQGLWPTLTSFQCNRQCLVDRLMPDYVSNRNHCFFFLSFFSSCCCCCCCCWAMNEWVSVVKTNNVIQIAGQWIICFWFLSFAAMDKKLNTKTPRDFFPISRVKVIPMKRRGLN